MGPSQQNLRLSEAQADTPQKVLIGSRPELVDSAAFNLVFWVGLVLLGYLLMIYLARRSGRSKKS